MFAKKLLKRLVPLSIIKKASDFALTTRDREAAVGPGSVAKSTKLRSIKRILKPGIEYLENTEHLNFLNAKLREQYQIVPTSNVSSNEYDPIALSYIDQFPDGIILDCGAGRRSTYYANVVNFEIVGYDTTDVLGVGEELPFCDNSFDAIFSLAVLEHVKDPFKCAAEIARVLKPGGKLYCVVPFLQPVHAFPNHFYNMSAQGLNNLFSAYLTIDKQEVIASGLPIWALSWILQSWVTGLQGTAREDFLKMTVQQLMQSPLSQLETSYVTELSKEKNFELACTTALFATK